MCCFRLHFSDFNVLFFQKNKKLTFKKITCCAKREKKITCREEKSQPPPPWISNGPSLTQSKIWLNTMLNLIKRDLMNSF